MSDKSNISVLDAINKLDNIEKRVIHDNNKTNILYYYHTRTIFLIHFHDLDNARQYVNKAFELLKTHDDKRYLGLFYELLGIIYNYKNRGDDSININEERDNAFIKEEILLRKYGTDEDNIDANYNLCQVYREKEDWKKMFFYADRTIHYINKAKVLYSRISFMNIYMAEGYIHFNQLEKAKKYLDLSFKDEMFINKNESFLIKLLYVNGLYYEKKKDFKTASENFLESNRYNFLLLQRQNKETNDFLELKDSIKIKKKENLKLAIENKLNAKSIEYKNYAILLILFIILVLISLLFLLKEKLKYKLEAKQKLDDNRLELIKINKQIESSIRDKKIFLDSITHELRTPLNTIKSVSYLLNNTNKADKLEHLDDIEFSSDYLLKLINNMIDFNTFEKNKKPFICNEVTDLETLISKIINTYKIKKDNNNEFLLDFDKNISSKLLVDRFRITQVLINLLDNSNKFSRNGKIIVKTKLLKSKPHFNSIEFSIQDNGIGIVKKNHSKVFDLFFQGSKEISIKYGGSGIGLSIVKKTIELFEKEIIIESDLGKGTTILFSLDFEISRI